METSKTLKLAAPAHAEPGALQPAPVSAPWSALVQRKVAHRAVQRRSLRSFGDISTQVLEKQILRLCAGDSAADAGSAQEILSLLRQLTPPDKLDESTDDLCRAIELRLTGEVRWRALTIRRHGPEAKWPTYLRGDTLTIITKARESVASGAPSEEKLREVADLLRPLPVLARRQVLSVWRSQVSPSNQWKVEHYDELLSLVLEKSLAPETSGQAPILDLETRLKTEKDQVFEYFMRVFAKQGFAFRKGQYHAVNIRGYERTKTGGAAGPSRVTGTGSTDFDAHLFVVWKDEQEKGHVHPGWAWTTAGPGAGGAKLKRGKGARDQALGGTAQGLSEEERDQALQEKLHRAAEEEDQLLKEWVVLRRKAAELKPDDPAAAAAKAAEAAAYQRFTSKRVVNNRLLANEEAATPWTMQGQYEAVHGAAGGQKPHPTVGFYVPNAGITKSGSGGYMPAYRDYSGSGTVDNGQRDIGNTAIGTRVLIHHGVGSADSQGCNVGKMRGGLLRRLNTDMSKEDDSQGSQGEDTPKAKRFSYIVVEAENLPPWE